MTGPRPVTATPAALRKAERILRRRFRGVGPITVRQTDDEIVIGYAGRGGVAAGGGGPGLRLYRYVNHALDGDALECVEYFDGETSGATVMVAKPRLLRRTPFDLNTYGGVAYTYSTDAQRTAVQGANTEVQRVTMDYTAGDWLWVASVQHTGVVHDDEDETPVRLLDVNVDGRAWARVES